LLHNSSLGFIGSINLSHPIASPGWNGSISHVLEKLTILSRLNASPFTSNARMVACNAPMIVPIADKDGNVNRSPF